MKIRKETFGPQHESVGEVYTYIGGAQWQWLKDYDQALINLKKAIDIQEKTLPSDSLDLATTYNNIAVTYALMEKYDLALQYHNKTLKIRQAALPPEHPSIAATYNNLGYLYDGKEDYAEALKFYQKSLEIQRKTLPPAHPNVVRTENNIRDVKNAMKK
jgi:tetratricopeptide (TPR) repeat protein